LTRGNVRTEFETVPKPRDRLDTKVYFAESEFLQKGGARSTCYPAPGRLRARRGFRIDIAWPHAKF